MEDLVRKLSTEVADLSNELVAAKTEAHKTNLNDSPDKINTFLENAGARNKKLDELFKDSQDLKNIVGVTPLPTMKSSIKWGRWSSS